MAPPLAVCRETWVVVGLTVPYILQMGTMQLATRATLCLVGHYDPAPIKIAAAALGNMYASITGLSLGIGISVAVGPYCAQNFGRGAARENGIVVRHCFFAQLLCFLVALFLAEVSAPFLGAAGQPAQLLTPVQDFARISAFAWPGNWMFSCLSTVLASQHNQLPGVLGQVVSSVINFCIAWALLAHGTGFLGVAVANVVASWASVIYMVAYVVVAGKQDTVWRIPDKVSAAKHVTLSEYMATAMPMACSMWAEWWAAELLALFAGWLPRSEMTVAAHGILFNTLAVFYMCFVSVSRACMIRVGQQVGAQDVAGIRLSLRVSVAVAAASSWAVAALLIWASPAILRLYTHDEDILELADDAYLGMVLSIPPYAVMICLMGGMRSAGLQVVSAKVLFVSFYLIGLPVGYYLGLVAKVGLLGIWIGNVTSLVCAATGNAVKISVVDWRQVVDTANTGKASSALKAPLVPPSAKGKGDAA